MRIASLVVLERELYQRRKGSPLLDVLAVPAGELPMPFRQTTSRPNERARFTIMVSGSGPGDMKCVSMPAFCRSRRSTT